MAEPEFCWKLVHADGRDVGDEDFHFPTRERAEEALPEDSDASPVQLDHACVFIACAECETRFDEEGENYIVHCADRAEALIFARDFGWHVVGESTWCLAEECEAAALKAREAADA